MDETGLIHMIYLTPVRGRGSTLEQVCQMSICDDLVVPLLKLVKNRIPHCGVESTGLLSQLAAYVQKRRYDRNRSDQLSDSTQCIPVLASLRRLVSTI
jgi:hypothetical protein